MNVSFDVPSANLSYPGRIVYVSPTQINVQVPWELQGQTSAQVKVIIDQFVFGNVVTVPLGRCLAGILREHSGIAAALDQNYAVVTTANPGQARAARAALHERAGAAEQSAGQRRSGERSSPLATTKNPPKVTIGGQDAPGAVQRAGAWIPGPLPGQRDRALRDLRRHGADFADHRRRDDSKASTLPVQ